MVTGLCLVDVWETVPPRDVYTHYTSHGAALRDERTPQWSEGGGGNRGCCIYRSSTVIPANEAGSPVVTPRPGRKENKHVILKDTTKRNLMQ